MYEIGPTASGARRQSPVEHRKVHEGNLFRLRCRHGFTVEPRTAEIQQLGTAGVVPAVAGDDVQDVPKAFDMTFAHRVVPLSLTDGQQRRLATISDPDHGDIDLVTRPGARVVRHPVPDLGRQIVEELRTGVIQHPIPAYLLELRSENIADEPTTPGPPHSIGTARALQLIPDRAHD